MFIIGYRAWAVQHLGILFVTVVLVAVGQYEVLTFSRADRLPAVTRVPAVSDLKFVDVRLSNPDSGPTASLPFHARTMPIASGGVGPGQGGRWNAIL